MLYKFFSQDSIPLEIPLHYQYNTGYQTYNYHPLYLMIPSCHSLFYNIYQRVFSLDQLSDYPFILLNLNHYWNLQIIYIYGWTNL